MQMLQVEPNLADPPPPRNWTCRASRDCVVLKKKFRVKKREGGEKETAHAQNRQDQETGSIGIYINSKNRVTLLKGCMECIINGTCKQKDHLFYCLKSNTVGYTHWID